MTTKTFNYDGCRTITVEYPDDRTFKQALEDLITIYQIFGDDA